MQNRTVVRWLTVSCLLSFALAGCGDSGADCGAGTVEMDGSCVPAAEACGPGTRFEMGRCVPANPPVQCAEGTTLMDGECVPDVTCGPGTVAMGGDCVPDGSMICPRASSVFNPATGMCELTDDACADGTVLIDGRCVPFDDTLMADFNGMEVDDPNFDGEANPLDVPDTAGDTVTVRGCITPDDFDMTAETTEADADFYAFSVTEPTVLRINADGLGGGVPAFAVVGLDPRLARSGWTRIGLTLTTDTTERELYLPVGGDYVLIVFDARSVDRVSLPDIFLTDPVGSEETCYFLTIEKTMLPAAMALTGSSASGTLNGPTVYSTSATARTIYQAVLTEDSAAAVAGVTMEVEGELGTTSNASLGLLALSPAMDSGDELVLVVESVFNFALDAVPFDLELNQHGEAPADGDLTVTHSDELFRFAFFEATAGDVVHFTMDTGGDDVSMIVIDPLITAAVSVSCGEGCTTTDQYLNIVTGGTYYIRLFNDDGVDGEDYTVSTTFTSQTPAALVEGAGSMITLTDTRAFASVDPEMLKWIRFSAGGLAPVSFNQANFVIFDRLAEGELGAVVLELQTADSSADFGRISLNETSTAADPTAPVPIEYLISIEDDAGFDGGENLTFQFAEETFADVTIAADGMMTRMDDVIRAASPARYLVQSAEGNLINFTADGEDVADVVIDRLDVDTSIIRSVDETGPDAVESMNAQVVPAAGWVAFAVDEASGSGGLVDVTITADPPPYDIGTGTGVYTPFTCDGTNTLVDEDDGVSASRALTTFAGFEFFGMPVTGVVASSNGWFTFDTGYAGGTGVTGDFVLSSLGTATEVVAPLDRDLIALVCIQETAERTVLQYTGQTFDFFGAGDPVEMQAILYEDGRIEFVFGPGHVAQRFIDSLVGLIDSTGEIVINYGDVVAAGQSILFTPTP